ncbi:MAG: hypothetical protein GXX85_17895 [Ignavibacteria bacterium]|nr:hypothetical protein [Ignavibacteria bacterium]
MKFQNIIDWLEFVNETSIENLNEIFHSEYGVYFSLENYERLIIKESLLTHIKNKLSQTDIEEKFWNSILNYIHTNSLTEKILNYLIDNKIALLALGHHSLDDIYLWKLVDDVDEAVLTLGKRYCLNNKYSTLEFKEFLKKFSNNKWLWETLINLKCPDIDKQRELRKLLFSNTSFDDLKNAFIEEKISLKLRSVKRERIIRKYYNMNNPKYWNAIAQNPSTPIDILSELVDLKNSKYANQIRKNAKNNLQKKLNV